MLIRVLLASLVLAAGAPLAASATSPVAEASVPLPRISPQAAEKRAQMLREFGAPALTYLESLKGRPGFKAPSELDARFTLAFYVNAEGRGEQAQRMWVLQRDGAGGPWRVGLWDKKYWQRKGLPAGFEPPYSWLVSTGRKYAGDPFSGPTPTGVFGIDERKYRLGRGYTAPGMINVVYIDLHYSGGRRSGVAFHGTTHGRYGRLGAIDSHGCIRMTQANALAVLDRLQGRDKVLSEDERWGEVPRFWRSERGGNRYGYTRDGTLIPADMAGGQISAMAVATPEARIEPAALSDATAASAVLTKTGYKAVAVIFRD
ncbi:MAG: L,D-transpeptidase family protein [Rhizobiales bacterium]|nr:L,D-transpeptidase family protein [Hyphomicrobiales bacterium]